MWGYDRAEKAESRLTKILWDWAYGFYFAMGRVIGASDYDGQFV